MAEGVIGLFAGGLQILDAVIQLKKVFDDMQSMPQELRELVEELLLLSRFLESLKGQQPELLTGMEESDQERSRRLHEKCVKTLQDLTNELNTTLQRHKKTGKLRVLLRKHDLRRCKERLQNAQLIMVCVIQHHAMQESQRGSVILADQIAAVLSQQSTFMLSMLQKFENIEGLLRRQPSKPLLGKSPSDLATRKRQLPRKQSSVRDSQRREQLLTKRNDIGSHLGSGRVTPIFSFQLPLWTVTKCIRVLVNRSSQSVGIHFRIYNIRPNDSVLFAAAHKGDWPAVRQMIAKRTASPFDVDEWGRTLLHYAASQAEADACRYLLKDHGLHASYQAWSDGNTPLESLSLAFRTQPKEKSSLNTLRLLLADDCGDRLNTDEGIKSWSHRNSLSSSCLKLLITEAGPQYEMINHQLRSRIALSVISFDPESDTVLLGRGIDLETALKTVSKKARKSYGHRQLLFNISRCLARLAPGDDPTGKYRLRWLDMLSTIINFESEKSISALFRSIYVHFIAHYLWSGNSRHLRAHGKNWNDVLTSIGRIWLQHLVERGANLERYGKAEKALLSQVVPDDQAAIEIIVGQDGRGRYHCHRVKFFLCGPKVNDWKLFVEPAEHVYDQRLQPGINRRTVVGNHEYKMAHEFWSTIQNPELFNIPGTYPTEEQPKLNEVKPKLIKGPIF